MNYTCVVLGDINIDYITDISNVYLHDATNSCIYSSISSAVGGNGTFFAEASIEAGFESVKLICSMGNDVASETAVEYFDGKNIELINIPSFIETGKVLILYQPEDKRILIADRGANKTLFTSLHGKASRIVQTPTNMLYVSGYSMFNDVSTLSLNSIIQEYKSSGAYVIIDAVPHDVFHNYNWKEYIDFFRGADGITIEWATAIGFMEQDESISIDNVADFLLSSFNFCLIRLNSESDFLIADKNNRRVVRIQYQPRMASLRFTDRVIAQIMIRYINNPNNIFSQSQWINDVNNLLGGIK